MKKPFLVVPLLLVACGAAFAQPAVTFTEFPLSTVERPAIVAGSDGALWYADFDAIGRITTAGAITRYALPDDGTFYPGGRGIAGMTLGPDGAVWFTESVPGRIARIGTDGVITEHPLAPDRVPFGITTGPDAALWYTEGVNGPGRIGRMTTDGAVAEFEMPQPCGVSCSHNPWGIVTGPDGALWFTNLGDSRVWRMTTSGSFSAFGPPPTQPGAIVVGPDAAMWFTAADTTGPHDRIGRITTTGALSSFLLPIYPRPTFNGYNNLAPLALAVGPDGAIWFTAERMGVIGRLTPDGQTTFYRLPGGTKDDEKFVSRGIALGPDGALWIATRRSIVRAVLSGEVTVDVKPGSCTNPFNPKANGVLPVAILGSAYVDVTEIDLASIRLEGVAALRANVEDVASLPVAGSDCAMTEPDGYRDLALKFPIQGIVDAIAAPPEGGATVLRLTGRLKPEFGGAPIHGQDVVMVKRR